jgi:hypothetical protein
MRTWRLRRRFKEQHAPHGSRITLSDDHPAVTEGRTLFPTRVSSPDERVLKSGINSRKIGNRVLKGKWYGMPIFTLTLEERATCPRSCAHWKNCYGSNMPFPKRYRHGPELEKRLEAELSALAGRFPAGFVVRLHILGDFYSVEYVNFWHGQLEKFPNLHVFGYTARWIDEDIGVAIMQIRVAFPSRWWVRFSGRDQECDLSTGESGIICPVQTGKTEACGTCALCWTAKKPIRFLVH